MRDFKTTVIRKNTFFPILLTGSTLNHKTFTGIPKDNILTLEEVPKQEGSEVVELESTDLEHLVLKAAKLMQQHGGHLPLGFFE